jgi:hypothetical protein
VIHCTTAVEYSISRAELAKLSIEAPDDYKVVNVFDDNVRQWSVEQADGKQKISIQLFEPAKKTQRVEVELEKFTSEKPQDAIQVPVVKAIEASRQQGVVVVQIAEGLRGEISKSGGLLQIDAGELPPALTKDKWAFSYRYAAVPYDLSLKIEKIMPRIAADSLVEAYLEPEKLSIDLLTIFNIERAGVFRLELDLPPDYDVRNVRGVEIQGAAAVRVDNHHLEGDKKSHLVVNLSSKAIGRVALAVNMQKDLHLPELLAPTGKSADVDLPLPQVTAGTVERASGRLIVYSPESLRVNPGKTTGLRAVSFQEALAGIQSPRAAKPGGVRPVLAFAFDQEPGSLALVAERRKPYVTIRQLLVARIEDGVAKYQATFFYNIQYSGVKSLRIDLPEEVAKIAHTQTAHETVIPSPADLPKGYVAWRLRGESELFGDGKIELVWENKIDKLDIGKSVNLPVPYLKPADVDRAWGQIVLAKSETIDIREQGEPKALQPIDPQQDLMEKVEGAARAFAFHDDWEMTVVATRYQLEEVKRTSIERGIVRMVVTPANEISVQALYRIRTARDRLAVKLPENVQFDTEPLKINGRSVMLEHQKGDYYIPIVAPNADTPFVLEMRFSLPGDGRRLDLPIFPQDPAVQKIFLAVYLPETKALLGVEGQWTKEFCWRLSPGMMWYPQPNIDKTAFLEWVHESAGQSANMADNFQTDGTLYVYSTLRPEAPPQGSLQMKIMDNRLLKALIFLGIFLGGVALAPARCCYKALAVGATIAALVLLGVFCPTFSMQILNGILILAIFLVLVLWGVMCVFNWRKRCFKKPCADKSIAAPGGDSGGVVLQSGESPAGVPPQPEPPATAEPTQSEGNQESEGGKSNA